MNKAKETFKIFVKKKERVKMDSFQEYRKMAKRENLSEFNYTNVNGVQKSYVKDEKGNFRPRVLVGGVTRKLLTRRKVADLTREIGLGHGGSLNTRIKEFVRPVLTNQSIHQAVRDYLAGGARKKDIVDKYGEINNWDVSKVTNMNRMFDGATSFDQSLNKWNVCNVRAMWNMFQDARSFNQPLNDWNVSNVTSMLSMFMGARSLVSAAVSRQGGLGWF